MLVHEFVFPYVLECIAVPYFSFQATIYVEQFQFPQHVNNLFVPYQFPKLASLTQLNYSDISDIVCNQ